MASIHICLDEPIACITAISTVTLQNTWVCIYEGICRRGFPIPNTAGIRNDVVSALRKIHPAVVRWPGGNFADDYHWQDGIGERASRPRRVNIWWDSEEPNHFGTHEFIRFCRLIGAEPYLCGNVGSSYPRELRDWVEYCNYNGDSTLARQRAANGSQEPFGVRYWGVGNENWAAGGAFEAEDYAIEYKRFATYLRDFGTPLYLVACGAYGTEPSWTRRFFEKMSHMPFHSVPRLHGFGVHYYCGTAGTATDYTEQQWYNSWQPLKVEDVVTIHRAAMDSYDPQRRIGLAIDEWGTWHPVEEGRNKAHLWQQNTMRDALGCADIDIFNRHADKVVMANIAQTINVLQALVLTTAPDADHADLPCVRPLPGAPAGQSLRLFADAPLISFHDKDGNLSSVPGITGSASLKDGMLTVSLVNTSATDAQEARLQFLGGVVSSAAARVLAAPDIHAVNTFEAPDTVTPQPTRVRYRTAICSGSAGSLVTVVKAKFT